MVIFYDIVDGWKRNFEMGRAAALPYQHYGRAALPRRPNFSALET
jgi:hypothetical protein